jgi:hypothetical protein
MRTLRLMLLTILMPLMTFCTASTSRADELPSRPTQEWELPSGFQLKTPNGNAQCFVLPEWQQVGHLVVDYRLLFAWAGQAEALYSVAQIEKAAAEATAFVEQAAADVARAKADAALIKLEDEKRRSKRLAWVAGLGGGLVVVLGGVVFGLAMAR